MVTLGGMLGTAVGTKKSVAQRVARRFRSAARKGQRRIAGTAMRHAIGPEARNDAQVIFCTRC